MIMEYKGFTIQTVADMPTLYEIKFAGRGKLAAALEGSFTTPTLARSKIDLYLNSGGTKKVVSDETSDKVGV